MKTPEIRDVAGVLQYLLEHDEDDWRWLNYNRRRHGSSDPFLCHRIEQMYTQRGVIGRELMREACAYIREKIAPEQTLSGYDLRHGGARVTVEGDLYPPIRREYLKVWLEELSAGSDANGVVSGQRMLGEL